MIRRWLSLIGKELREHWLAGLGLSLLFAFGFLSVIGASLTAQRSMTMLEGQLNFLWTFIPLGALVLGNRLVVTEWYSRTQLFVEALPLPRGEQVFVKFLVGLVLLESAAAASLGLTALMALRTEPIDERFLAILESRGGLYVACVWAFFFTMGFLGRLRFAFYIGVGLGLAILEGATEIHLSRWGPFALVARDTFPFERVDYPVEELSTTAAVTLGLLVVSLLLATMREGSLAEVLSRRMSQKEKVAAGLLFFLELMGLMFVEERHKKGPLEFKGAAVARSPRLGIAVLYATPERKPSGEALAASLDAELADLLPLLRTDKLPPVRIAYDSGLDSRTFETAHVAHADGVLVRARFGARDARDAAALEAHVVREVIDERTTHRAHFEPKRWVHDGFARWWVERDAPEEAHALVRNRALWATRQGGPDAATVQRWNTTRERLGERIAEALAWSGLRALEAEKGRDAVLALARDLFGRDVPSDATETFREWREPMPVVFERATGLGWEPFLEKWRAWLERERAAPAAREALARVPEGKGVLAFAKGDGLARTVSYRFELERPPAAGTLCALIHDRLGPFDYELTPSKVRREEHAWEAGATSAGWEYAGFGAGERAFLGLEVDSEELACPLRLTTLRTEIE